jgi:hypothetical protein
MRSSLFKRSLILTLLLALFAPATGPQFASAQSTNAAAPGFSAQRGFYDAPFNLNLSPAAGTTVYYTLDGSTPSAAHGTLYSVPIPITTSTIVRAIATAQSLNPSPVITQSYIFPSAVRNQSDTPLPGWPTYFANPDLNGIYPADYQMDPDVVNHPNNSAKFTTVLKSLPSLSLVTDLPYLWNVQSGIYYNPNARGNSPLDPLGTQWQRPMSLEWINPDGTTGFAQMAGATIDGQTARRPHRQPKKNFRIDFSSTYGPAGLDFDLFDASVPAATFDEIILRNGSNRSWSYFDKDQRREADYVNDEFARRAWTDMGNLALHGTYVHLYINGLYWGLYNVTESLNPEFLTSYLGTTPANFDIVHPDDSPTELPEATAGTVTAWNQVIALLAGTTPVDNTLYQDIASRVDVVNLADYMIHAHYIGKTDWPEQNWNAYRMIAGADTRFKFTPLDNDTGLNKLTENTTLVTDSLGLQDSPDSVFRRLLTNPEFVQVLADRLYKHVASSNGALATNACVARYSELATTVDQAVIAESARWGDYIRDKYPPTNNAPKAFPAYLHSRDLPNDFTDPAGAVLDTDQKTWVQVRDSKLGSYCSDRDATVVGQYVTNGWYQTSLLAPNISQAGGMINSGSSVTLSNANGTTGEIYYTTNGSDPRAQFGAIAAGAVLGNDSVGITISANQTIKARVYNGGAWSPLLEATFYLNQSFGNLVINEINYGPIAPDGQNPNDYEFVELHNRGGSAIQLGGVTFTSGIFYQFGQGVSIPAGGYLVLASNASAFQSRYGFAPDGVFTGSLLNGGETVELSNPANGVIDTVSYQSVAPWPTGANQGGGSLSLLNPTLDNSIAPSWAASAINGGTPRAANDSTPGGKQRPNLTAGTPAPFVYGTPLQLNATADVPGIFQYSPPLGTVLNAGADQPVQVIFTPSDTNAYVGVNTTVYVDVTPAPLTIAAVNKIKQVGKPLPLLEATYSGFVNGDTPASLDVAPTLSTTATDSSPVGDYPITVSGALDANYTITFVGGILTVTNKTVPTITWAKPAAIVYGTALSSTQLNASASDNGQAVGGTYSYSPPVGTVLQAGNAQELHVVFTPADTTTYVSVEAVVTIDVARAPLIIKADNKFKLVGTENPPLTATYSGLVNGDTGATLDSPPVLSTTAMTGSPLGIYPITISGASDANYNITMSGGTLTVVSTIEETFQYKALLPLVVR